MTASVPNSIDGRSPPASAAPTGEGRGHVPVGPLYVFGDDQATTNHVLDHTSSGDAAVNTCAMQSALPSMGFGDFGNSGIGRHQEIEGFREFSNPRGVFVRGGGLDRYLIFTSREGSGAACRRRWSSGENCS